MRERTPLDARTWLVWAVIAATVTMMTRNPLYTALLFLLSRVVDESCAGPNSDLELPVWRISLAILLFSGAFSAVFVHQGQTIVLRLPPSWPLIGGPITAEAFLLGLGNGLVVATLFSLFVAFNRIVPVTALARLAPRAFQDLGVVVLIALTYVPETMRHVERVREAQAVRGHQIERIGDWRPLIIPLLIGGMERALMLAEAMVARGFGAARSQRQSSGALVGLAVALSLVLAGWVVSLWWGWSGWLLLGLGLLLLAILLWRGGRRTTATRYRPSRWGASDVIVVAAALLPLLLVVMPLPLVAQDTTAFSPFPRLHLPPFDALLGFSFLLFAVPVAVPTGSRSQSKRGRL